MEAGLQSRPQLVDRQLEIEGVDLAPRGHHVVDGDPLQVEQVEQHRVMLGRQIAASLEHQRAHFLARQRLIARTRIEAQRVQHRVDEEIDEPHDRIGDAQQRRQQIRDARGDPIGVVGAHDLG